MTDNSTFIYNSLNLPIEAQRKYNLEKYHFLSGILDILTLHLQLIKEYNLTQDDIYKQKKEEQGKRFQGSFVF